MFSRGPLFSPQRTSTTHEIKDAYRKLAMALHPDRTDGDEKAADQFKEASEAYDTLSNHSRRTSYDMLHNGAYQRRKPPPPNYRKVYSPRAPPGFKTFDPKAHYDMHYGDGQMKEEVGRAMKRAKEAAGKEEYQSPLGPGFSFSSQADQNPYSKESTAQGPEANSSYVDIDYEESHFYDSDNGNMGDAKRVVNARERVRGRLHEQRNMRIQRRRQQAAGAPSNRSNEHTSGGCTVM
jgi:curved DNA-binding protein CbpA